MITEAKRLPAPEVAQELLADPKQAARAAGLRYVNPNGPGIRRLRSGKAFRYIGTDGKLARDEETLARIKKLVIPPAWEDVWISPIANGHLQAVGRDARGRKQYRYHAKWRVVRDEAKYGRTMAFARALPRMRRRIEKDLSLPGLPCEKVLATVVRLLETTLIRVGNEEYAKQNRSFGLTTMRDKHAKINSNGVRFEFTGKSGKKHSIGIHDRRLARIVKRCRDLPGQDLFQYTADDGSRQSIGSADVNEYLREISGEDFTAKDFRTWAGTVLAAMALSEFESFDSETQAKKNVVQAIERVSERLGNTPAICRKCYVHPDILDAYIDGELLRELQERTAKELKGLRGLEPEEAVVLAFLEARLSVEVRRRTA